MEDKRSNLPKVSQGQRERQRRVETFKSKILDSFGVGDDYLEFIEALNLAQSAVINELNRAMREEEG